LSARNLLRNLLALAWTTLLVAAAAAIAKDTGARCLLIERSEINSHRNG
jgi:hypothetical protein